MKEAAGYISRLMCQINGQRARRSSRTREVSCVVVRGSISRSSSNGNFAALAHNRRLRAHALLGAIAFTCLVLTGCGGSGATEPSSAPKIGPAGGTVTEASGAKVVIPTGALTQDTAIAVTQTSVRAPALPTGVTPSGRSTRLLHMAPALAFQ